MQRILAPLALGAALGACSSTIENRNPTGPEPKPFPSVAGKALDGTALRIPEDLVGRPAVLLVGYTMNAQFDGDRWLVGLLQTKTPVRILELPTIEGMVPGVFSGMIDGGMRKGIPSEDWGGVVTLYGSDASRLVELTGNTNPRNMRVFLLDRDGRIVWFHDRGFSAGVLLQLDEKARTLAKD